MRAQVGDLDQADRRGDHHRRQRRRGQVLQQVRRHHQQQRHAERADHAGQLGLRARGLGHRRARRTAADRESPGRSRPPGWPRPGPTISWLGSTRYADPRGIGARQHAGVGEGHQRDGAAAEHAPGRDRRRRSSGTAKRRQALRQRAEHRHARPRPRSSTPTASVAPTTAISTPGTRWRPLSTRITASVPAPMASDASSSAPSSDAPADRPQARRPGPSPSIEKPNSLGSWLISTVSAMPFM